MPALNTRAQTLPPAFNRKNHEPLTFHTFRDEVLIHGGKSVLLVAHCLFGFGPNVNSKTPPAAISLCRIHARDSGLPFSRALCTKGW